MFSLKRYYFLPFILLFFTSCTFWTTSNIKEIKTLQESKDFFQETAEDILVIFDIDRTLIVPVDKILRIRWNPEVFDESDVEFAQKLLSDFQTKMKIKSHYDPHYEDQSLSAIMSNETYKCIESSTASFIKDLQFKGIKVIALTSIQTGKFGQIAKMGEWRYSTLKEYGIDFSSNFEFTEIVFDKLKPNFDSYPVFYKGILMTGKQNPKGLVLKTFFDSINWKPKKIYFFDDTKKHLESVATELKLEDIPFQGFWYTATFDIPVKLKLDRDIIKLQYDYLAEHNKYLNDAQAEEKLNKLNIINKKNLTNIIEHSQ